MIEVRHLTKRYGGHTAVNDLSFTIEPGAIYGLLGPNGAGKSTTMNIITGCLGASSGEVLLDGVNILDQSASAKRRIGYLPEQPPLYVDMTPLEYLRFVARAKGLRGEALDEQLLAAMERTGTLDVRDRLIRNLSKGYRQRVGIAQAMLGDPEVLILDEPTVGLDPAQIIEIRELIRELGQRHTIVLSSHILSEVQAVCDRILILSHGVLAASDTAENLTALFAGSGAIRLECRAEAVAVGAVLDRVEGVERFLIRPGEGGTSLVELRPRANCDPREALFNAFAEAKLPLLELHRERASLEEVFLELTRDDPGELREAEPAEARAEESEEVSEA